MPVEISTEQLKQYFSGNYWHPAHDECTAKAAALRHHADGTYPEELIEERRPHESLAVKEYRCRIWEPITKPDFGKVLLSLAKIRRSTEWSIKFDAAIPPRISPAETLEQYLTMNFPHFTSIVNWAFAVLLREAAIDANAWIAVMPSDEDIEAGQYLKPYPYIFRSEQIVDVEEGRFIVALAGEKAEYTVKDVTHVDGARYYVITDTEFQRWDQVDTTRRFEMTWLYQHNLNRLPAFQMRGVVVRTTDNGVINESRLAPMLPRLNEAAREYSDLQAEVVQHIYSEKWEIGDTECTTCSGKGECELPGLRHGLWTECIACNGTGFKPRGPYTTMMIKAPMAGEANAPIPPAGYIQKDTDIVKVQDERIDKHIRKALAAVAMEHVADSPLDQSGIAKAYDDDETNTFAHAVAEDLVAMLDSVCDFTNELRNALVVPDSVARRAMLPQIAVPERFDLFSAAMVEQELLNAKDKGVNPVILNALELQYAVKKFSNEPEVRDRIELNIKLDPLANVSEENKMVILQNKGITLETYIISSNIYAFINRALDEKGDAFYSMKLSEQKGLITSYAKEQLEANSMQRQVLSTFTETQNNLPV